MTRNEEPFAAALGSPVIEVVKAKLRSDVAVAQMETVITESERN